MRIIKKSINVKILCFLIIIILSFSANGLFAQEFPAGDFWSLSGGLGMSDILVKGISFQLIVDPKLWITPSFMVGTKMGANFAKENHSSAIYGDILTFETQVYARWNFLRFGSRDNPINVFGQLGLGLLAAYRGRNSPFDDVTATRGSLLGDVAVGITIPLTKRMHIEPIIRSGYPHLWGFSLTIGYKFPLPKNTVTTITSVTQAPSRTEYVEIIKTLPASEIIRRFMITSVEFIMFGPDIERYNVGVDFDAQQLNELVLNQSAEFLTNNPDTIVRIEGHVNPYTISNYELDELSVLSSMRANVVAEELRKRGVRDEQMVIISFGGARTITNEFDIRNRNRRVELIIIQIDSD